MFDRALLAVRAARGHASSGVLRFPAFRRLLVALSLASLGDWLGLLALTAMAQDLAGDGYAAANLAIAGVFMLRLAPAIVLGPLAGVVADRLDRRWTMVWANAFRGLVLLSVPLVGGFWWLFVATFLLEAASLFFLPAKEATVPNLVPREQLEAANQLNLLSTYGSAPIAAALFAGLSLLGGALGNASGFFAARPVATALWANAATFLVSAVLIARIRDLPARGAAADGSAGIWRTIIEGWAYIGRTPLVRGLVAGILGAVAAGGAVIGLARTYVGDLGAGDPGYGLLFGVVFVGLAAGMALGPGLFRGFSRRRLFGLSIALAGCALGLLALIPNMVIAVLLTATTGAWAGVAWVTGYTLLGLEVADEVRGRTFAFVQTLLRITLVTVLAVAPLVAAALGRHSYRVGDVSLTYNGAALTFLIAAVLAVGVGVTAYRQMDDRRGVPLWTDLSTALRHTPVSPAGGHITGFLLALEGGEGAGKSTQAGILAEALRERGHEVVVTREPGATPLGAQLRRLLLDPASGRIAPRAEVLLYAADRADHVDAVLRPALDRGAVVITDRYVDSSLAYQGAGRAVPPDDVLRISRWATGGLVPDLTVVLDVPPTVGLARFGGADRLEAEPLGFHQRVREEFLALARRQPQRYLVVDATLDPGQITALVAARLDRVLPPTPAGSRDRQPASAKEPAPASAKEAAPAPADGAVLQLPEESAAGPAHRQQQWAGSAREERR